MPRGQNLEDFVEMRLMILKGRLNVAKGEGRKDEIDQISHQLKRLDDLVQRERRLGRRRFAVCKG